MVDQYKNIQTIKLIKQISCAFRKIYLSKEKIVEMLFTTVLKPKYSCHFEYMPTVQTSAMFESLSVKRLSDDKQCATLVFACHQLVCDAGQNVTAKFSQFRSFSSVQI